MRRIREDPGLRERAVQGSSYVMWRDLLSGTFFLSGTFLEERHGCAEAL
jgi:hypothetical protein